MSDDLNFAVFYKIGFSCQSTFRFLWSSKWERKSDIAKLWSTSQAMTQNMSATSESFLASQVFFEIYKLLFLCYVTISNRASGYSSIF